MDNKRDKKRPKGELKYIIPNDTFTEEMAIRFAEEWIKQTPEFQIEESSSK